MPADPKGASEGGAKTAAKAARRSNTQSKPKAAKAIDEAKRPSDTEHVKKEATPQKTQQKAGTPARKDAKANTPGASPEKVKRERPQYDMPGQTQPTPDVGEPLAKFYLSLLQQRPDSEIAPKW